MKKTLKCLSCFLLVIVLFTSIPANTFASSTAVCTTHTISSTGEFKYYTFLPSAYFMEGGTVEDLYDTTSDTPKYWHVPAGQKLTFYVYLDGLYTFTLSVYKPGVSGSISSQRVKNRGYCSFTAPVLDEDADYQIIMSVLPTYSGILIKSYSANWTY